jgi:hypothetical protein
MISPSHPMTSGERGRSDLRWSMHGHLRQNSEVFTMGLGRRWGSVDDATSPVASVARNACQHLEDGHERPCQQLYESTPVKTDNRI